MPDVVLGGYSCPCGWKGNSRQALYWHKQNSCKLREQQPDAPQEPAKAALVAEVAPAEPAPVMQEKPARVAVAGSKKTEPEPDDEEQEDEEPEPEDEDDKFEVLLLPIIIVVLLITGLIIFREKIVELFEKMKGGNQQPPAYGVPSYG